MDDGSIVNTQKRWKVMSKYIFATSLVMLVGMFFSAVGNIIKEDNPVATCCNSIGACGAAAFLASVVWIPIVIFAPWSKPCYKAPEDGGLADQPFSLEYKGFLAIWIVILCSFALTCCILILVCCVGGLAMAAAASSAQHASEQPAQ